LATINDGKDALMFDDDFEGIELVSLTEEEKEICRELSERAKDGSEYMYVQTPNDGYYTTSGEAGRVAFDNKAIQMIENAEENSVNLWHYHPAGSSFSNVDLEKLSYSTIASVEVVGGNGYIYKVSVGDGWRPPSDEVREASLEVMRDFDRDNLSRLILGEVMSEEYNYLMSREVAYQLSNRFEWTYTAGEGGF
jgi:hypothetical protein